MFVKLSMFINQNQKKSNHTEATFVPPFGSWKIGHVLVGSRTTEFEEWTIKSIDSADGKPRREDCVVSLVNTAGELRQVKGSTLQSSYRFHSVGDVVEEPKASPKRTDVQPMGIDPNGVREFYPRKSGDGTRILMHDKTAYIVAETFDEVWKLFHEVGWITATSVETPDCQVAITGRASSETNEATGED